jgi:hypothetical protein
MLQKYLVTTELKTSTWVKILRFFKLKKKREEFFLEFHDHTHKVKDVVHTYDGTLLLILKKK